MISVGKLFEVATYAPPAESPTTVRDSAVKQRRIRIRKMIGKQGQKAASAQQEIRDIEKVKTDPTWGTKIF
jgi:hypothetical protein